MKTRILHFLTVIILCGCAQTPKPNAAFDNNKQIQILNFYHSLFESKIINSKNILDSLTLFADKIIKDTANYTRRPKANLYISTSTHTWFQVFENPKGTITAIAFYLNNNRLNVAEYYENGQVTCRFSVDKNGKRNGQYECYNDNGTYKLIGYYQNDKEIKDSLKRFDE